MAIAAVGYVLLSQSSPYTVKARFQNASQLVKGNTVQVAGAPIGTVKDLQLTGDGQAEVTLEITGDYKPLRRGTRAIVRQASLSGVANRYVDLQLGEGDAADIPSGGRIEAAATQSAVELDQIFNTFDPVARTAVQRDIAGFAEMTAGRTEEANQAARYLNPMLASTSRLFSEINRDTRMFDRFVIETAGLTRTLASRDDDLAGVVDNLATTSTALAAQRQALGESIRELPDFMRKANTTFVNLRATLDDVDPLVEDARPVARRLRPFLAELRPFAREAVPTLRDLRRTISARGADNDLIELLGAQPALDRTGNGPVQANGAERAGAFPETAKALKGSTPQFAFGRPYTPDFMGWLDDFSTSGAYDANGGFSRAGLALNSFSFVPGAGEIVPIPPEIRDNFLTQGGVLKIGRNNRCPGSNERDPGDGSTPYKPSPDFNCDASITPVGP